MARQANKTNKRPMKTAKKAVGRVGPMAAKKIAIEGFGSEPVAGTTLAGAELSRALTWYSSVEEPGTHNQSVYDEMKKRNYSKEDIASVKRVLNQKTFYQASISSIARMLQRDIILPEDYVDRWVSRINDLIIVGQSIKEEKVAEAEEKGIVLSIQDRTANKANEMFESFDDLAEDVWTKVKDLKNIKFFELFTELDMKPAHARILLERFKAEAEKYVENPKDYTKETIKLMKPFWDGLRDAATTWAAERQAKPKTEAQLKKESIRKALSSVKKAERAVATTFKFKPSDDASGVVSSNPNNIIGAQVVVLFNTKYNLLTVLHAKDHTGLTVKGTGIINYDEATSKTKRAGRATALIKSMQTQSKTAIKKSFDSIKGQEMEPKNRGSEEVVIVRIIK